MSLMRKSLIAATHASRRTLQFRCASSLAYQSGSIPDFYLRRLRGSGVRWTTAEAEQPAPNMTETWHPYAQEKATFTSAGDELAGWVFTPQRVSKAKEGLHPAVIVLGPVASVKEQVPMQYATRLAKEGFLTLVFDPRSHGASAGEPRRVESGDMKVADMKAAIDWVLSTQPVDPERLFLVGICQGVNWVLRTATQDARVKGISMISGNYLTPQVAKMMLGEDFEARMEASAASKAKFEATGEVDYIQVVKQVAEDTALLGHPPPRDYYVPWTVHAPWTAHKGAWDNRIAQMSEVDLWAHDVYADAAKLSTPTLMVHADNSANGKDMPKDLFEKLPCENKELAWFGSAGHLQFYDDAMLMDNAAARVSDFLGGL
eukprot:TRINITY_DN3712_c0_g1_i2.p2 TRINITY_DN3712_c0_g1~~TRINITY_DN3712_c0_g1_i2.p2  ORF type:complete len:374 (+),score=99.27 TRINITY_DN3712_c0_g1_i2:158-1279(+)